MREINVGIVDDDKSKVTQIMTYLRYGMKDASKQKADKYADVKFNVVEIEPVSNMEDISSLITEQKIDAVLIDYNLSSYASISYSGVQLAKHIQEAFFDFPLFILTSYEDELYEQEIFDSYQIFDFGRYLSEPLERVELHYKLIEQVTKYRKQIELWEDEIRRLLPEKGTKAEVDAKILELDSKLEKSIDGKSALSDAVKCTLKSNKLEELINKIDMMLKEE